MENIPEALKLLVVGMLTVFAILLIVIYLGKGLIAFVNKFIPEEAKVASQKVANVSVDPQAKAIINEAVKQLTAGKGHVTKVEKI